MREVIVTFKAYKEMVKYLSQYSSFKIPREKWVECMGILFGRVEGDYYFIEDAIGVTSGTELDVQVSPMKLPEIIQSESNLFGGDLFVTGWWHTHPGLTPFFSETDIKNQAFYQANNPDGLGIVFDHEIIDEDNLGFQIFRLEHQFSDQYYEVKYQLQGFTKKGIKECMELLGIDERITEALMEKYGDKGASIKIDFSKLGDYFGDDPLGDCEWTLMDAEELLKQDKPIEAIKQFKMAANMLENTEYQEKMAEIQVKIIQLCVQENYMENAKEEFQILKSLKSKIPEDKFEKLYNKIKDLNLE
ncbi:MAG: Mov34/MPN/PAD-1 family protein [Promethearchaeia archaeon]